MKVSELSAIIEAFAPEIRSFVAEELKSFAQRLDAIEATKAISNTPGPPGERGEIGPQGVQGLKGEVGDSGAPGDKGEPGERGPEGVPGPAGPAGEPGPVGPVGPEGAPGRDGRDGLPRVQGEKGIDGRNGVDGRDGFALEDFDFEFDPETRNLTVELKRDGSVVKSVTKKLAGILISRGTFDETKQYEPGDVVIVRGSSWCAKAETSSRPDLHTKDGSKDWRLLAQRGERGSQGLQGLKGIDGKEGRPGMDFRQKF